MAETLVSVTQRRTSDPVAETERPNRLLGLFPVQGKWREEQYFDLPESNWFVELSDGRLVMPDRPGTRHQRIFLRLLRRLDDFVTDRRLGEVAIAPLPVRLWPGKVREPDVMLMLSEHADRITERWWGPPDLVVEVVSPRTADSSGTEKTDREEKPWEYAQAGVQEYWLVHPSDRTIEVYALKGESYRLSGRYGVGETAQSELLEGFAVAVEEIMGDY